MKRSEILIVLLFALFFCLPIFLSIPSTFPRLDSDYDAVLPMYQYIGDFVRTHYALPTTIPFISTGIPILGDPTNGILNPLLLLPLIFFNINISIRITMFLVVFLSGITMFCLLKKNKLTSVISYFGACLYMTSGALVACVAAGHITEKFLSYPLIPLFLLFSIDGKTTVRRSLLLGLIMAIGMYGGDPYSVWFFIIVLVSVQIFYLFSNKHLLWKRVLFIVGCGIFFLLFASPKLYFFLKDVLPILKRPTFVSPFLGSIHAWFAPLQFLVPFQVSFYDRPFFQRHIGFYYNWYEYFGFLGLFPILFFKYIKNSLKDKKIQLLLFLLLVGCLYVASGFFYSPFHWLFVFVKAVDIFRVPQRIILPMSSIAVLLFCLLATSWKNKKTQAIIFILSLVSTIGTSWYIFSYTFIPIPKEEIAFTKEVAKVNPQHNAVVNFSAASEYLLAQQGIPITNYYYAWIPKNTPVIVSENGTPIFFAIAELKPLFILSVNKNSFAELGYEKVYSSGTRSIWKRPY